MNISWSKKAEAFSIGAVVLAGMMLAGKLFYGLLPIWGWLSAFLYLAVLTAWMSFFLQNIFKRGLSLYFSLFVVVYLLSFFLGIVIDLYKYSDYLLLLTLFVLAGFVYSLKIIGQKQHRENGSLEGVDEIIPGNAVAVNKYLAIFLPLLVVVGLLLLFKSRTGEYILTPWQVIPKLYVYLFLIITFTVVNIIFSKLKTKIILLIIIIYSLALHAYLPFVYQTGFGGDKWRHLASERYLLEEKVYSPALFGEPIRWMEVGPLRLPEVLVAGNKTSYGNMWAITIALSKFLSVDVFWVDYWLGFVLWSLFLPVFMYLWGGLIYNNRHFRLLLAFLPSIFYIMQSFGAITIPVAFGSLFFYFVFYLWMKFYISGDRLVRNFALLLSVLMYFGYILNFLLIAEIAAAVLLLRRVANKKLRMLIAGVLFVVFSTTIPLLEAVMGYGGFKPSLFSWRGIINGLADAFGSLTGLIAFIPRPIHIDQGNWLYNQTRSTQSSASLLSLSVLPFIFTTLVWGVILLGVEKLRRLTDKRVAKFIGMGLVVLLVNYIWSWYFMTGNHILARRLDLIIVFGLNIFFALGVFYLLDNTLPKVKWNYKVFSLLIILSIITISTYTSGPFLEVVTQDEVQAAKYVWQNIDKESGKFCVVANTWPLLAVEAESARAIIGGGFPVYLEYAQPERVKIFEGMLRFPLQKPWLQQAQQITGASECWYMVEKRWLSDKVWQENLQALGKWLKQIGQVYIWKVKY